MPRLSLLVVGPTALPCNQCGECCRGVGRCVLRGPAWSGTPRPLEFFRGCDLLLADGRCGVMAGHLARVDGRPVERLKLDVRLKPLMTGRCDYPDVRRGQ